jgi:hypothetical protein
MLGYNENLTVKAASEWEPLEGEYRKNGRALNTYLLIPQRRPCVGFGWN